MNESEWSTIYRNLSLKDTDDLISYWQNHNENEWTTIAIDVMEQILIERLGELPGKVEIRKKVSIKQEPEEKTNAFSELRTLITDNAPVFYDPNKVTALVKWIFRSLNILIVLYIIQFIFNNFSIFRALFDQKYKFSSLIYDLVFSLVGLLIVIIALFLQYKALGYVLKILKEMEFTSRKR